MSTETEKTEEEKLAAAERAIKANEATNVRRLSRVEQIADSAEKQGEHLDDEPVTDAMWQDFEADDGLTQEQRTARAVAIAAARKHTGDDPDDKEPEIQEESVVDTGFHPVEEPQETLDADTRQVNGVTQYRLIVNGKRKWQTLEEIRATAQKVESADEYLQTAVDTVKNATRAAPSAEEVEKADRVRAERLSHRKELLRRQAMGDEQAISELAELDVVSAPSAVTPDVLRALDERFDQRATFREAVTWFEKEFAPELKHPAMKSYAGELDASLYAQNPRLDPKERMKRVGDQIRQELKETYGLAARQGPSDKAIRKAEVRQPVQASARQPKPADEDETGSVAEDIARIAKAHGQPRAVVHGPIRK
jgi:hypothetical protein